MSASTHLTTGIGLRCRLTRLLALQLLVVCADRTVRASRVQEQSQLEVVAERAHPLSDTLLAQQTRTDLPPADRPISSTIDLRIAASKDPAFDIIQVRDLTVDRNGNIFVLDAADQQVKMFDPNGRPVRVFGRKGAGPGEFINAYVISVLRDSLWVIDRQNDRFLSTPLHPQTIRRTRTADSPDNLSCIR